jgi:hypothetical protein
MKTITIILITSLLCSGCNKTRETNSGSPSKIMTRHDQILKIMRENWITITEKEKADFFEYSSYELAIKMLSELEKVKEDYFYEPDPNIFFTTPSTSWEIEGPLPIKDLKEQDKTGNFIDFISKYKDGDEIYFWRSNKHSWREQRGREGYVLIRDKKDVAEVVTRLN